MSQAKQPITNQSDSPPPEWKDITKEEHGLPTPDAPLSWSPPWVLLLLLLLLLLDAAMASWRVGCGSLLLPC
jgi:hypothetical protein